MAVAIVAGNHLTAPWSGGGDTREYVTLARNMLAGDGYTFAHQPTAFRAPLYPLFLAAVMWLFPNVWAAVVHAIQFGLGLLTAGLCARLASRWFGPDAGRASLALALVLPSLAYFTGEILTECTAAALAIVFFLCLDEALQRSGRYALVALGISCGLAALERFNSAALAIAAVAAVFLWLPASTGEPRASAPFAKWFERERWARAFIVAAACVVVISPWLMHTWVAFHGRAIYSTHAGFAAVEGVLMPLGRTQPGETPIIENALGWGTWKLSQTIRSGSLSVPKPTSIVRPGE